MSHTIRLFAAKGHPTVTVTHPAEFSELTPEQARALAHDLADAADTADPTNPAHLPTMPGIYRDRQGDVWVLTGTREWILPVDDTTRDTTPAEHVARFQPLTLALTLDRLTD